MPTKKAVVVKSETAAAGSPAVDAVPAKPVRKRATSSSKKAATTTEAPAPVSAEKKSRASSASTSKKKPAVEAAAVTHRHKKQESAPPQESTVTLAALVTPYEPSHDEVAKLAYSYYEARGYQPGDPRTDWFRAVQELKARHAAATSLLED
jgi:hypothetical protein